MTDTEWEHSQPDAIRPGKRGSTDPGQARNCPWDSECLRASAPWDHMPKRDGSFFGDTTRQQRLCAELIGRGIDA
jgi:hypothetical protein